MSDITFISVFNEGCIELGINHLESLKRCGITNYIAYVTDKQSYNRLLGKYNVIYLEGGMTTNEKKDFNTEGFNKLSYVRYYVIKKYLEEGKCVWYMDVDTVVLMDLNDKYKKLLAQYKGYTFDAIFQSDINSICTGCMILFPTKNCLNIINKIINNKTISINDQSLMMELLKDMNNNELIFPLLDLNEFPNGYLYFADEDCVDVDDSFSGVKKAKQDFLINANNQKVHFIHANWMIGNETKIKNLKKYNLWFSQ